MTIENVSSLNNINNISYSPGAIFEPNPVSKSSFDNFYKAAIELFDETNGYQIKAQQQEIDYATGKTDNILSVLLAQNRAYSSLNFTVSVTNKIIESYREIMRMQL